MPGPSQLLALAALFLSPLCANKPEQQNSINRLHINFIVNFLSSTPGLACQHSFSTIQALFKTRSGEPNSKPKDAGSSY